MLYSEQQFVYQVYTCKPIEYILVDYQQSLQYLIHQE